MVINLPDTAQVIDDLIRAALPGVPVFWSAADVPAPAPPQFIVIEPLFPTIHQAWNTTTHAQHTHQVRACATVLGEAWRLANAAFEALPATMFAVRAGAPATKVGQHYDVIITPTAHAVEKG